MDGKTYVDKICGRIHDRGCRQKIRRELEDHIKDGVSDFVAQGYSVEEAQALAVEQMGEAQEVSDLFNLVYRRRPEWAQILCIVICTILARIFIPLVLDAVGTNMNGAAVLPEEVAQRCLWILGGVLYLIALCAFGVEKYHDLPFWYGRCQSGGSNANGAILASMAIALCGMPPVQTGVTILVTIGLNVVIRSVVEEKRIKKEQCYLFHKGKTLTPLSFGGYAQFGREKTKVLSREDVEEGAEVIAVGIDGFRILVEPVPEKR